MLYLPWIYVLENIKFLKIVSIFIIIIIINS